jgi:hypothetical protein
MNIYLEQADVQQILDDYIADKEDFIINGGVNNV